MFRNLFYMLLTACIMQASAQTGNVGVGTSNPAARLDIAGDVALREGAPIAVSGNNPTVTVSLNATQAENSFYRITGSPTGSMTLNSIANGVDGQLIRVVNTTTINLNVTNNNATNGILTPSMSAMSIPTYGNITLQYSAQMQRWYVANFVGSVSADWIKTTTTSTSAVKTDNQYITGNAGIGDFSTIDPAAELHVYNGVGSKLTFANVGTALAAFDGGSGTVNSRVIIGSNFTGSGTRPESQLEFWNNAFGGGQGNSATISTLSSQGTASGQVNGTLLLSTSNNSIAPTEKMRIENDGDVGIGTTAPYAKLDVLGSIYTTRHGNNNQHDASEQGITYVGMKSGNTSDGFAGMKMQVGAFGSGGVTNGSRIFFQTWGNGISVSRDVMVINENGNVGIGTSSPNAPLQFANTAVNRKIVMWDATNNDNQYYGFGINGGTLRYQVDGTSSAHKFYCGTSATTSKQLAAFGGDGNFYMGDPNATVTYDINILPARPIGGSNATYLRLGSSSNFVQDVFTNNVYAGRVRIGSSSATFYPLEVSGTASWTADCREFWHTYGGSWSGWASRTKNVAILSHGSIAADGDQAFISASDVRIKKDIHPSNSATDLDLLSKIEIADYSYKDTLFDSNTPQKKVIAQQVEQVFPQAITKTVNVIPNIYAEAENVSLNGGQISFELPSAHGLKASNRVKIYNEQGVMNMVEVISCPTDKSFTATLPNAQEGKYFIYGVEVDDFRNVDYDALAMLNISATQELYKKIKLLEEENARLMEIVSTKAELEELKLQIEQLKNLILNDAAISSNK